MARQDAQGGNARHGGNLSFDVRLGRIGRREAGVVHDGDILRRWRGAWGKCKRKGGGLAPPSPPHVL